MGTLDIRVKVSEKENKEKGNKFLAYKAVQKNGTLIDLKFQQVVTNKPTEVGEYIITVNENAINFDQNRVFPCVWCKEVLGIKPVEQKAEDKRAIELFK